MWIISLPFSCPTYMLELALIGSYMPCARWGQVQSLNIAESKDWQQCHLGLSSNAVYFAVPPRC